MPVRVHAFILCVAAVGLGCGDFSGGPTGGGGSSAPVQLLSGTASTASINAFGSTLYPILRSYCADCHAGNGPGSPAFAHPSTPTAYNNIVSQGKVDLAAPGSSRIVQKVAGGHECWTPETPVAGQGDCETDAQVLLDAIAQWSDLIDFGAGGVSIDETLASSTLSLADGVVDVSSERYSKNLVALYEFKEGSGTRVYDTSGNPQKVNLDLDGDYEWMSSWGIQFNHGKAVSINARPLWDAIASPDTGTGQYTVEVWATPANIVQDGPARIVTYSRSTSARNFTLGQNGYDYVFRNRAVIGDGMPNGTPALETYDGDQDAQAVLQHVVLTYDQYRGRRIYVNGVWTDDVDEQGPGPLWNWGRRAPDYRLTLGDEPDGEDRHWEGQIRLVAIYRQALTQAQILQNFQAGVGRRLLMRFDISQWTTPGSSIQFVVSQFDNYSYLFCEPTYESANPSEFRLANIRIAVNGDIPPTGQGFRRVDTQVAGSPQLLSRQCAVIPVDAPDPDNDTFTLVFEHLAGLQNLVDEGTPGPLDIEKDPGPLPVLGLRDFAQINETMSVATRVDPLSGPEATYLDLKQQLPEGYDLRSFVSSQQVGIAKLSLEYCNDLVDADAVRADTDPDKYFPGFPFGETPETAFDTTAERNLLFDPLFDNAIGDNLADQPTRQQVRDELNTLIDTLMQKCTSATPCDTTRTLTMAKGVCAAVLSSAAVSID